MERLAPVGSGSGATQAHGRLGFVVDNVADTAQVALRSQW